MSDSVQLGALTHSERLIFDFLKKRVEQRGRLPGAAGLQHLEVGRAAPHAFLENRKSTAHCESERPAEHYQTCGDLAGSLVP